MNKIFPTLYKKDQKDKVRQWIIKIEGNSYTTSSGLIGGELISTTTICKAKAHTTSKEQALKEATAKWKKKQDREQYSTDPTGNSKTSFIAPMKALDATKVGHRLRWSNSNYIGQAKLNGVRAIAEYKEGTVKITSRLGKEYNMPHISKQLLSIFKIINLPLDGELYIHGLELGDIKHLISNKDTSIGFHIFDIVDTSTSYSNRLKVLNSLSISNLPNIYIVPGIVLEHANLDKEHDSCVAKGYEGIMIKDSKSKYGIGKRTPAMFKYKKFQDSEFEIIGVVLDKNNRGILQYTTKNGVVFKARSIGDNTVRQHQADRPELYIGKFGTVRYSTLLKSGAPEFPRTVTIRDYE